MLRRFMTLVPAALASFAALLGQPMAATTQDYKAIPPFIAQVQGKPNVIIALDNSGSMKSVGYRDTGAGNWKTGLHDDFDPAKTYFGYFDSTKKYRYNTANGYFRDDANGDWDGNYLNWLAMRRMDFVRKVLVGGKVRDRAGENIGGETLWIIEGQNEPEDYTFRKAYSNSDAYSPIPDGEEVIIADGKIKPSTQQSVYITPVGDYMEVGKVTLNRDADTVWVDIEFENTYATPIVVATAVSYEGGDPTVARVKDVTGSGFKLSLEEYEYKDGNHTTEDVIFIVAESGYRTQAMKDSKTLHVVAGKVSTSQMEPNFESVSFPHTFSNTPVAFAGVSTVNEADVVNTRIRNISISGMEVAMEEQELNTQSHAAEEVHYVAIEPVVGELDDGSGTPIEVASTGTEVDEVWHTINFTSDFADTPLVALNMQTTNGTDTANVRFGNSTWSKDAVDVQVDEEQSLDSETGHADEVIGYLAVPGTEGYNIQVAVTEEPTGIVQEFQTKMRLGLAVYNFDHSKNPTNIYTGNSVHGGTLNPCYPDVSLPAASRTNYDICLPTHVKAPIDNIINVIEDYPLVWGTTPIAETLYEIYGYVTQTNHGIDGHTHFYDSGATNNSYEVNDDWDPYYYSEYSAKLPCVETFVLHFNDGAPWKDWDTPNNGEHPTLGPDLDGDSNPTAAHDGTGSKTEMLDDMAFHLRKNDCRGDIDEHQEIISYYVFAALGEGEQNNDDTRKMREAAVNGGFFDKDGDNEPDPAHPSDFKAYYNNFLTNPSQDLPVAACGVNEWDEDGDCNPDTFYYAYDGYALVEELRSAFSSILRRASTGGAASVISASSTGEGAVYQGLFHTTQGDGSYEVAWTGDVYALFVDDAGYLRQDDGDKVLEGYAADKIIDMCYDDDGDANQVRVALSASLAARPPPGTDCEEASYPEDLFSLEYLWSGGTWLKNQSDVVSQRTYVSITGGRHIITALDTLSGVDGKITEGEQVDFVPASFSDANAGLLQAADATEAAKIVNFIRGQDQSGYRSRMISDTEIWRLGDIIYSIPTPAARPAEAFDLLYGDATYGNFLAAYKDRRTVVYTGANDGMLHAFNAGYYDAATKTFNKAASGDLEFELGAELWAYVPYNLLPHLKYLTSLDYGKTVGDHVYYVDLKPRIFDARIFGAGGMTGQAGVTHTDGWGTVLVGGMRFGGGAIEVDVDPTNPGTDRRTLRSSYFILDITDPDKPPKLLREFTHADLGFTTAIPAPFVVGGHWYLLFGSGPDETANGLVDAKSTQQAKLFMLDLHTMELASGFGTNGVATLTETNSFISDLIAVDWDLDYNADAVHFGTVSGTTYPWSGQIYRLQTQNADGSTKAVASWQPSVLHNSARPITAKAAFSVDKQGNHWVYVGSGRFYTRDDARDTSSQRFYGLKEPRNTSGGFTWGSITSTPVDVSNAVVKKDGRLSGVTATGLSALPDIDEFKDLMTRYSDSTNYQTGWYREFTSGERVIGEAAILAGTLTHTTYEPSSAACSYEGESTLFALNYTTGTAGSTPILGLKSGTGTGSDAILETEVALGVAPALTPSIHMGEGYDKDSDSKAFIQTSTGKIIAIEQENQQPVRSGERSWRRSLQ